MEIPVYFFSGFLSGGKTTFIQNVLKDPSFCLLYTSLADIQGFTDEIFGVLAV